MRKYRLIPIFRWRKIGKHFYYTTEYVKKAYLPKKRRIVRKFYKPKKRRVRKKVVKPALRRKKKVLKRIVRRVVEKKKPSRIIEAKKYIQSLIEKTVVYDFKEGEYVSLSKFKISIPKILPKFFDTKNFLFQDSRTPSKKKIKYFRLFYFQYVYTYHKKARIEKSEVYIQRKDGSFAEGTYIKADDFELIKRSLLSMYKERKDTLEYKGMERPNTKSAILLPFIEPVGIIGWEARQD